MVNVGVRIVRDMDMVNVGVMVRESRDRAMSLPGLA
jgi:hypothetical protein